MAGVVIGAIVNYKKCYISYFINKRHYNPKIGYIIGLMLMYLSLRHLDLWSIFKSEMGRYFEFQSTLNFVMKYHT